VAPTITTPTLTLDTRGEEATRRFGVRLGRAGRPGDVILLQGDLGAGKTRLAQGIGRGLDVDTWVNSPTFVLISEYDGRLRLYHADLYRLDDPREVRELHLGEQAREGVLVVEWPERGSEHLPAEHLLVRIERLDEQRRRLTFEPAGERAAALAAAAMPPRRATGGREPGSSWS
jgi:tRNA threonylcarbamoyladenosine biosynthesis protein TsaE